MNLEQLAKIKERIAKLLAMAKDAASPNEAAIAAQRARKLMDQYQLDEYDISEAAPDVFAEEAVGIVRASVPTYLGTLAVAVARYNDCHARYQWANVEQKDIDRRRAEGRDAKTHGKRIKFQGYANDVELCKQMYEYLCANMDKLCKEYMSVNHPGRYNVRIGTEYKSSAVAALCARLKAMTKERMELVTTSGSALVVVKAKAVDEKFGAPKYANVRRDQNEDYASEKARSAGYRDGHKISITPTLNQ